MMEYGRVMLDLETMAVSNSRSLVLSVGLVPFRLRAAGYDTGDPLLILPDLTQQLLLGRRVTPSTQDWWSRQTPEAASHWAGETVINSRVSLVEALDLVRLACYGMEVWANGIVFDLCNLTTLAEDLGLPDLWTYSAARDARTLYKVLPRLREAPTGEQVSHDPVSDCLWQVHKLWEHWPEGCFDAEDTPPAPAPRRRR